MVQDKELLPHIQPSVGHCFFHRTSHFGLGEDELDPSHGERVRELPFGVAWVCAHEYAACADNGKAYRWHVYAVEAVDADSVAWLQTSRPQARDQATDK